MPAKKYQNPKGGLNAAGRAYFKRTEGANLKAPVKSGTNPRRVSFAARFAGMKGPMKDEKGRPTRLALSLSAWGAPRDKAKARAMGQSLLRRYKAKKEAQRG